MAENIRERRGRGARVGRQITRQIGAGRRIEREASAVDELRQREGEDGLDSDAGIEHAILQNAVERAVTNERDGHARHDRPGHQRRNLVLGGLMRAAEGNAVQL